MRKFKINYTVLNNFNCTRVISGDDEKEARSNLKNLLVQEGWDGGILTKKDIVVDSLEEQVKKKKRR